MIRDYLWRRSLEFDGETPPSPSTCQHKRLWSHFEVFVEMSRSKRCRPNGGDRSTSGHFSPGSAHFSATPCYSWTRPLTPIWRSHRGIGCDLRPHHSPDTKLPGLLDLRDFYCTTLHCSPIADGVLHNIWWYRTCHRAEIGNIELD